MNNEQLTQLVRDVVRLDGARIRLDAKNGSSTNVGAFWRPPVVAEHVSDLAQLLRRQVTDSMIGAYKLDANETAMLVRQLTYQLTRVVEIQYTPLRTLDFFPVDRSIPRGAKTYTYEEWDKVGEAKSIANYADDLPLVDVVSAEVTGTFDNIGAAYQYSREDLRASAMSGQPLVQRKRMSAAEAIDRRIDTLAAEGNAPKKIRGVLSHPNIPLDSAAAPGSGSDATWPGGDKTPKEVLADLMVIDSAVPLATKGRRSANWLLLPPTRMSYIANTPYGTAENSDTILATFKKNARFIRNIDEWHKLETAGADGGPSAFAYDRNPLVLDVKNVFGFEELPPEVRNLAFVINCEAKAGGLCLYEPLGTLRMDGI